MVRFSYGSADSTVQFRKATMVTDRSFLAFFAHASQLALG